MSESLWEIIRDVWNGETERRSKNFIELQNVAIDWMEEIINKFPEYDSCYVNKEGLLARIKEERVDLK